MALHILLLLFSCGIWYWIWNYRMTRDTNAVRDEAERNPVSLYGVGPEVLLAVQNANDQRQQIRAAAAYVLSNDEMREKIVRSAVRLYSDINGGMAELKEQMADMQAELQAQGGEQDE